MAWKHTDDKQERPATTRRRLRQTSTSVSSDSTFLDSPQLFSQFVTMTHEIGIQRETPDNCPCMDYGCIQGKFFTASERAPDGESHVIHIKGAISTQLHLQGMRGVGCLIRCSHCEPQGGESVVDFEGDDIIVYKLDGDLTEQFFMIKVAPGLPGSTYTRSLVYQTDLQHVRYT